MSKPKDPNHLLRHCLNWRNRVHTSIFSPTAIIQVYNDNGPQGTVLVDKEDLPKLKLPLRIHHTGYAFNHGSHEPVAYTILGRDRHDKKGLVVDHIYRNRLDNRKCHLRLITHRENSVNREPHAGSKTGISGLTERTGMRDHGRFERREFCAHVPDLSKPAGSIENGKRKRAPAFTKSFTWGKNRTKEEARQMAIDWINAKRKEVGLDQIRVEQ